MRRVRDGETFTQDEVNSGEAELETPEPVPEDEAKGGELQQFLGGLGETWDTVKIPVNRWRRSRDS